MALRCDGSLKARYCSVGVRPFRSFTDIQIQKYKNVTAGCLCGKCLIHFEVQFFHSSEFKHWSTSIATAKELTCAKFKGSHFVREHEAFVFVSSKNSS